MNNVTINLSEHFTLAELTKTKTGINNVPNEEQVNNLKRVCGWLEQLRRRWNNLYGDGDNIEQSPYRLCCRHKVYWH